MKYQKVTSVNGNWLKGAEVVSGTKGKLTSETNPTSSQFLNKDGTSKTQDVAKIRLETGEEDVNISINRASINALVDAFGEDSKDWIGKVLTVVTEKMRVGGKAVTAVYLVPEGYTKVDDENGYAVIVNKDLEFATSHQGDNQAGSQSDDEVDVKDIPF